MSTATPETCNVCGTSMAYVATARVLSRLDARYFSCPNCHFVRTEKPHWLPEAYSQAIAATDTGIVLRNLKIARQLTCVLPQLFAASARFIDVAGGTGLLTRLMRDYGFHFYWEDIYCQNVLAFGFDAAPAMGDFAAVTAFEAVEHMEEPYAFIKACIERSSTGTFIFTTELFDPPLPNANWWYFSWATGQHISFFSAKTLQHIAQKLQVRFLSHRGLHLFTRLPIAEDAYKRALDQEEHGLFEQVVGSRSGFAMPDHIAMTIKLMRSKGASEAEIAQFVAQASPPTEQSNSFSDGASQLARSQPKSGWLERTIARWRRSIRKRIHRRQSPDSLGK